MLFDPTNFKQAVKDALREALDEQRDWMRDVVLEAIEDIALAEAVREGEESELVDRNDVMAALRQDESQGDAKDQG